MWSYHRSANSTSVGSCNDDFITELFGTSDFQTNNWSLNSTSTPVNCQDRQWSPQIQQTWQPTLQNSQYHQRPNYIYNTVSTTTPDTPMQSLQFQRSRIDCNSQSYPVISGQILSQTPLEIQHPAVPTLNSLCYRNNHHTRISFIPGSTQGFNTVIKRKRKRTQFTTEQVEILETFFRSKPYVCREERQVLLEQLQVSDSAIKIWFQNRRLRGKRDNDACYTSNSPSSEESFHKSLALDHLDKVVSELNQKADEFGYITLDDKALEEIAIVIDKVLYCDVEIDENGHVALLSDTSDKLERLKEPLELAKPVQESEENSAKSEDSTYEGNIYEPISPASPEQVKQDISQWAPFAPEALRKLFELHFC